jgi:hypothetical protein
VPMAQLGLARALAAAGDRAGSLAAYRTLLEWWKEADAGLPVVERAREEAGGV